MDKNNFEDQIAIRLRHLTTRTEFNPKGIKDMAAGKGRRPYKHEVYTYSELRERQKPIVNERVWRYICSNLDKHGVDTQNPYPDELNKYVFEGVTADGASRIKSIFTLVDRFKVVLSILNSDSNSMIILADSVEDEAFFAVDLKRYLTFSYRTWQMACVERTLAGADDNLFPLSYDGEVDANFRVVYALDNRYPSTEMYRIASTLNSELFQNTISSRLIIESVLYDVTRCYPRELFCQLPERIIALSIGYIKRNAKRMYDYKTEKNWPNFFVAIVNIYSEFIAYLWKSEKFSAHVDAIICVPERYASIYKQMKEMHEDVVDQLSTIKSVTTLVQAAKNIELPVHRESEDDLPSRRLRRTKRVMAVKHPMAVASSSFALPKLRKISNVMSVQLTLDDIE